VLETKTPTEPIQVLNLEPPVVINSEHLNVPTFSNAIRDAMQMIRRTSEETQSHRTLHYHQSPLPLFFITAGNNTELPEAKSNQCMLLILQSIC
jgi:hypothetical protein